MKKYTVGFIFNKDLSKVLLVHKTAPAWQVGKINGVGGKVEQGEEGIDCIVREVLEETGLKIAKKNWRGVGTIEDEGSIVEVYGALYNGKIFEPFIFEKEMIEWFFVSNLPDNVIFNLHWLIPLTIEKIKYGKITEMNVKYAKF